MTELPAALAADLTQIYGLPPDTAVPVSGGWLNKKWKIRAGGAFYLVKQFSRERFSDRQLMHIRRALTVQAQMHEQGFPCPRVLRPEEPLRTMPDGTVYTVMTFCPGIQITPETVTTVQMRSLGENCARMKQMMASVDPQDMRGYPLDSAGVLAGLHAHLSKLPPDTPGTADAAGILDGLTPQALERFARGTAHEDFSPDNMLFDGQGVTAILDFDRTQYGFVLHDIGRILMSLAWHGGVLDSERIRAFRQGYETHLPLSPADIADALRITWITEFSWWITASDFSGESPKIRRFREETLWLGGNRDLFP